MRDKSNLVLNIVLENLALSSSREFCSNELWKRVHVRVPLNICRCKKNISIMIQSLNFQYTQQRRQFSNSITEASAFLPFLWNLQTTKLCQNLNLGQPVKLTVHAY